MKKRGTKSVSDSVLAAELGVTQPQLGNYRGRKLTPKQVANLLDKSAKREAKRLVDLSISPIVEFFEIEEVSSKHGARWEIFSERVADSGTHPFLSGIKTKLQRAHGVYIFYDSRGRAIYAGKAQRLDLWTEINNAYNRDRKEVQSIKRVSHPSSRVKFNPEKEARRQIAKEHVALHHIANYFSAYEAPEPMIGKIEALLVRAFANDLLNVRMEKF